MIVCFPLRERINGRFSNCYYDVLLIMYSLLWQMLLGETCRDRLPSVTHESCFTQGNVFLKLEIFCLFHAEKFGFVKSGRLENPEAAASEPCIEFPLK